MTTPTTRRSFLGKTLVALCATPLLVKAALANKEYPNTLLDGPVNVHTSPIMPFRAGAIKVPSNRWPREGSDVSTGKSVHGHVYIGEWDGTFKLERDCTNPAYVLADLYERTGEEPDWVFAPKTWHRMPTKDSPFGYGPPLNWQMLYDWGQWCDETVTDGEFSMQMKRDSHGSVTTFERTGPRFTVSLSDTSPKTLEEARQVLRMHCLRWQPIDPRYRTSWPGISYPEGSA